MRRLFTRIMMLTVVFMMVAGKGPVSNAATSMPNITVVEQKPIVVYTGVQNTITYTLENKTVYSAKNLSVVPDTSVTGLEGFRLLNTSFTPSDTAVIPDRPVTITLEAVIDDTVPEGVYPIRLLIAYENQSRDRFERDLLTYFEVKNDENMKEDIRVYKDNSASLVPDRGENFTFEYTVKNGEAYKAANVKTYITGLPREYFALVSNQQTLVLGDLRRAVYKDVDMTYHLKDETPVGSYLYTIVIEYENEEGNRIVRTADYNLYVGDAAGGNATLQVQDITYPTSAYEDATFTVGFTLSNPGADTAQDVVVRMKEGGVFMPKSPSLVKKESLTAGETWTFQMDLVASGEGLQDRNYPIEFEITYDNGGEEVTDTQIMGVYVNSIEDEKNVNANAPKIIISKYLSEPQMVKAGSEFDLYLDFMNTNLSKSIYNVKAYITANESTEDTGNVFTPVGSSNTFYIAKIAPETANSQSIKLFTVPDAAPKTYNLTINFEYEDGDGNTYTATEFVGIPVTQVTKLESSDFSMPAEVMAGEGVNVYFDIFNTGKAKVYNLIVKAEGNFTADPMTRYIGNLDVGNTDYFDAYVNFVEPGLTDGKFVISFEDAAGEQTIVEKTFSVNVMEAFMPEFNPGDDFYMPEEGYPGQQGGLKTTRLFMVGGGVGLLLVLIIILLMRRRRKKKMEMMFDENE